MQEKNAQARARSPILGFISAGLLSTYKPFHGLFNLLPHWQVTLIHKGENERRNMHEV